MTLINFIQFCSTLQVSCMSCPRPQALQTRKSHAPSFPHSMHRSPSQTLPRSSWAPNFAVVRLSELLGKLPGQVGFHSSTHDAVGSWKRFRMVSPVFAVSCYVLLSIPRLWILQACGPSAVAWISLGLQEKFSTAVRNDWIEGKDVRKFLLYFFNILVVTGTQRLSPRPMHVMLCR